MTAINRQPTGLLGFLGIKNFGRNPTTLGEQLAPTWDLSKLYLNTSAWYTRVDQNLAATGYIVYFQVPQGEVWQVHQLGWFTANPVPAGEQIDLAIWIADTQVQNPLPITPARSVAAGFLGCDGVRDLVLSSGEQMGLYVARSIGAAKSIAMSCRRTVMYA